MNRTHGTNAYYMGGCRCAECRRAHSAYRIARGKAALAAGTLTHGLRSTYNAGCRCERCEDARRVDYYTLPGEYGYQRLVRQAGAYAKGPR